MRLAAWLDRLLLFASLLAQIHSMEVFGILGENFTFPVNTGYKMDEIIWTKNKDKVVEWEGLTKPTYFTPFQKRGLLNTENGCLTIYNLEKSDAGIYVLEYLRSMENSIFHSLTFVLAVLDPPSEPEISCNMSSDGLALKCTADFQKPLTYFWKVKSTEDTYPKQEISIPKEKVDASDKIACLIKFYQMEKSSEISLSQCLPDQKGDSCSKRSRVALIVSVSLCLVVGIVLFLVTRGILRRRVSQRSNMVHGSDRELMMRCSALKEEQMVNGVNQEDNLGDETRSLLPSDAAVHSVNEAGGEEVPRAAREAAGEEEVPWAAGEAARGEEVPRAAGEAARGEEVPRDAGEEVPRGTGEAVGGEEVPQAARGEEVPQAARGEEVPRAAREEEVPRCAGEEEMPWAARGEMVPRDAGEEVPRGTGEAARGEEVPQAAREEVPRAARGEEMPWAARREEVPRGAGGEEMPWAARGEEVSRDAGEEMPRAAREEEVSGAARGEEVPWAARGEEMPRAARGEEMPWAARGEEMPWAARGEEVPRAARGEEMPWAAREEEVPRGAGGEEVPWAARGEEMPWAARGEEVPQAAGEEKVPQAAGEEEVLWAAGEEMGSTQATVQCSNEELATIEDKL